MSQKMIQDALLSGTASAPGDLPLSLIRQRVKLLQSQFRHDNRLEPLAPIPDQPVTVWASSGGKRPLAYAEVWYTTDQTAPQPDTAHRLPMRVEQVTWDVETRYLKQWRADIPAMPAGTVVRYRIAGWETQPTAPQTPPAHFAHDGHGMWFAYEGEMSTFAYRVAPAGADRPAWMNEAVIYQIFLDRFHPGNENGRFAPNLDPNQKHGGTLLGVERALPYLADLGINCIWLSPLGPAQTYHRYDATDYFGVDPDLGTNDDLKRLIEKAHKLGMRMILDFVPSHFSWEHPAFVAAQADPDADTADWFIFDEWPDKYRCFLSVVPSLVSLNGNSAGVRRYLNDSATFWLTEMGFDGLRLDHSIGHGSDFWVQFQTAVQSAKPDAVLIAEATDTPDALKALNGRLQILDFPLAQSLRLMFGRREGTISEFNTFLDMYTRFMQDGPGRVSFLDNHDMNRFLFVAGDRPQRLKMALLCQMTLSPTPIIYYGSEVGMSQVADKEAGGFGGDSEVRRDMPWDPADWNHDLLTFYKAVIDVRHQQTAVWQSALETFHVDDAAETLAYGYPAHGVAVLFNWSQSDQAITMPTAQTGTLLLTSGQAPTFETSQPQLVVNLEPETAVLIQYH